MDGQADPPDTGPCKHGRSDRPSDRQVEEGAHPIEGSGPPPQETAPGDGNHAAAADPREGTQQQDYHHKSTERSTTSTNRQPHEEQSREESKIEEPNESDNESMDTSSDPPSELQGLTAEQAMEVESAVDFMQQLFEAVFADRPPTPLPPIRRRYPELNDEEMEKMFRLFIVDIKASITDARKWRSRLQAMTEVIYKSRNTLRETLMVLEKQVLAKPGRVDNPWLNRMIERQTDEQEDVDMTNEPASTFRFLQSAYSAAEIAELRSVCEQTYGFPRHLIQPTKQESAIVKGLVEGSILCSKLPDFLKRICINKAFRVIQNTIKAQVEGDLILQFPPNFKIYPQFQSRAQLTSEILLGICASELDSNQVVEMLKEAKQICYDKGLHAVHLILYTRELATKWSNVFDFLNFRNRKFPLRNVHLPVLEMPADPEERAAQTWARQIGADGIQDEQPRERYHIRLLNISRFLDEGAIDTYIQKNFKGIYTTLQEPTLAGNANQTDTWDIFFRCAQCPEFLDNKRFIGWGGTKILIHHASKSRAPPCFSCGGTGHMRTVCTVADDFWCTHFCLTGTSADIATLPQQPTTVTSIAELEAYWVDEKEDKAKPTPRADQQEDKVNPIPNADKQEGKVKSTPAGQKEGDENPTPQANPTARHHESSTAQPAQSDQTDTSATQTPTTEWQTARAKNTRSTKTDQPTPATPTVILPRSKATNGKRRQPQREPSTAQPPVEEESQYQPGRSITEEVQATLLQRTAMMKKNRDQTEKIIAEKKQKPDSSKLGKCAKINTSEYRNQHVKGEQVLTDCGLVQITTPATGNCQYYAKAMALLQREFGDTNSIRSLETLTTKIKRGLVLATQHYFDQEFPHDHRVNMLKQLDPDPDTLEEAVNSQWTDQQTDEAIRDYFNELGRTSSKLTSIISKRYWGSAATLRMLAEILQRPIFVIMAEDGLTKAHNQIYEPKEVTTRGETFSSAAQHL